MTKAEAIPARTARCPICTAPTVGAYRPFCSRRCADIDLGRWLGGGYVVAGGIVDADEDGDDALAARQSGEVPPPGGDDRVCEDRKE